jgi:predicted amidohydrolase YtcJ
MLEILKEKVKTKKPGEWIEGLKWNELNWNEGRMPTREDLDKVSREHPIYCTRLCYHVAVANSKALAAAGITKDSPDPEGGAYGRDENGEPNGLLLENAMASVVSKIPEYGDEEYINAIESIGALLNRYGVTTAVDANLACNQLRAYSFALRQNRLTYRARPMFFLDLAEGGVDAQLRRLDEMSVMTDFGNDRLKFNAVKIMLDGIPAVGTAYFRRNYRHMPETNGFPAVSQEDLDRLVLKAHGYGWQVGIHALGDKAADMCIAAYKKAEETLGNRDARHYIIHHPWPCADQFELLRKYDIAVTMQISIFHLMGEAKLYFDDMAQLNTPYGLYFKEGVVVGGSSDSPIGHPNPFLSMFAAVTRQDSSGTVFGPEHAVSPSQALIAYTMYSAYISHDDALLGSVEKGKLADLVILDRDFIEGPTEEIKDTKPVMTILGGQVVFDALRP